MKDQDSFFNQILERVLEHPVSIKAITRVSGGDINDAYKVTTQDNIFFIKTNQPSVGDLFEKERLGMKILLDSKAIHVPKVLDHGYHDQTPYLILEYLEKGTSKRRFWEEFGTQMADLHRNTQEHFGLNHDNYIGKLPQSNTPKSNWIDFFIEQRIEPQLHLAINKGLISSSLTDQIRSLYHYLPEIFPTEKPSLLHGDLWSGNFMTNSEGSPTIFDPAVYYGHREMELAFTQLFGGFDQQFYNSYNERFPLSPGFEDRIDIYNIYPLMVHVNLFGPSYLSGIQSIVNRFN